MHRLALFVLLAFLASAPDPALAWGNTGHRIIGAVAMRALPTEVPAFLRTPQAAEEVGELSREPDRSRDAGKVHDSDRNPAHYVDLGDDGRILGGPALSALPVTRQDYETALRGVGQDNWKAGYLPYSIIDRWEQLAKDFAYWRVLKAAEANPAWNAHRAWFAADRRRREGQILRTIGELSHFVADGSQPLHVSVHHHGWGDYPNPAGYSKAKLHEAFEGDLVRAAVRPEMVAAQIAPLDLCNCAIAQRTAGYLVATGGQVVPFYELEKAGGLAPGDLRGPAFASRRMAVGASELRDLVVEAWRASEHGRVGWRPIAVTDVERGKVDPYPALYGTD